MPSNRAVICCKTVPFITHCMLFLHNFPTTAKIYVSGKELKMLFCLKVSNPFDYVTLCNIITILKKAHVNQCPKLRHVPSKMKYKFVVVCGKNIMHYFYNSFSELYIYLHLINLHLIIDYLHFYYYIPF